MSEVPLHVTFKKSKHARSALSSVLESDGEINSDSVSEGEVTPHAKSRSEIETGGGWGGRIVERSNHCFLLECHIGPYGGRRGEVQLLVSYRGYSSLRHRPTVGS